MVIHQAPSELLVVFPGSCAEPLLFTVFINEIPLIVSGPMLLLADDTKIFCVIRNGNDHTALQTDLDLL